MSLKNKIAFLSILTVFIFGAMAVYFVFFYSQKIFVDGADCYWGDDNLVEIYDWRMPKIAFVLSAFVFVMAIFAGVIVYFLIAHFLRPLEQLNDATVRISEGNLNEKVDIKTGDEFEELGSRFNTMSGKLLESRVNIEKKVAKRTEELEKANKFMVGRELKMLELKKEISQLKKNK